MSTRRILVADDEAPLLAVMAQYLRRIGYEVTGVKTAADAWAQFETDPAAFTVFIADATLQGSKGHVLLQKMRALHPELRVLIASGYPFDLGSLPAELREKTAFLQKPFTPKQLADCVQELVNS